VNTEVEKPLFIEVDVWGVKAKYVADNFKSGDLIFIEGFLRLKEWQKDGIDFRKIVLIAENIDSGGPAKPFCDYLTRALKKIKGTIRQDELRRLDDSLYLEHESKIMNESKHQYRD
jgi:single-stranded DNA-binding protein